MVCSTPDSSPTNAQVPLCGSKMARPPYLSPRGDQVSHQRWIWGIHYMQVMKHASKRSALNLKPGADATRSPKQGYQWPHKKTNIFQKDFFWIPRKGQPDRFISFIKISTIRLCVSLVKSRGFNFFCNTWPKTCVLSPCYVKDLFHPLPI